MIITLPLIASLLFILSQATEFEHKIDPTRCGVDTACFVRDSCITVKNAVSASQLVLGDYDSTLVAGDPNEALVGDKCDVFVQMKEFSKSKYLVLMELTDASGSFDADKSISITQKGKEQIACQKDNPPSGNDEMFTFKSDGSKPNQFEATRIFCSFFANSIKKNGDNPIAIENLFDDAEFIGEMPTLVYYDTNGNKIELKYNGDQSTLWRVASSNAKCSLENVVSNTIDDTYILDDVNLAQVKLKCSDGAGKLLVTHDGKSTPEVDIISCRGRKWSWGNPATSADPTKPLKLGCIKQRYCTACADTIPEACTTECTKPTPGTTPEGCKTLTCPENSFAISAEERKNLISGGDAKCEKKEAGKAVWFTHEGQELNVLSCRTTIPCVLTNLKEDKVVKCPEDRDGCQLPTISAEDVTCPDELKLHKGDEMFTFKCDKTDGKHNAGGGPIYCAKEKSADADGKEEAPSGAGAGTIAGIAFGVIALAAGTGLAVWQGLKYKKRKAAAASKGAPASSTKASNKKSSEQSKSKSAEVKTKDKKESGSDPIVAGDTPKEPAKVEETPKDKVETPGVTPATTAPTTPATPATPAAPAAPAPAAAPPKSNSDDQTANAPV